jgi:anaerobic ribonucleoside-triphosphate reductase activating protein
VAEVAAVLHPLLTGMDGLTISGGEPFDQAGALCTLLATLRQSDDIEVLVYTGYRLEELQAGTPDQRALLAQIDLLIDGPFRQELPNTRQWRGSDNQRLHLLSARAQSYRAQDSVPMPDARPLQVQMLGPTRYRIIGIPRRGDLERYQALLAARGIQVRAASEESSDADSRRRPE